MIEIIKKGLRFIYRFIRLIPTALLLMSLLFACLAQYVAPSTFMLFSYFGLAFPIILVLHIIWGLVILYFRSWKIFLVHLLGLFTLPMALKTFPLHRSTDYDFISCDSLENNTDSTFKVLSYNVGMFACEPGKSQTDIVDYICKADADICFIQEYRTSVEKKYPDVFRKLYDKYPFNSRKMKGETTWGVVTFSKHPIIGAGIASKGDVYNTAIYSDIILKGDTIRAINCHLISNHLTTDDKDALRQIGKNNGVVDDLGQTVHTFDSKFITSYASREAMANDVSKIVSETEYKIVLTGDFNDVPISYAYNKIKSGILLNAKEEAGFGYNRSFNEIPFIVSIDHIMYSPALKCIGYYRDKVPYSDHYPTLAKFSMAAKFKFKKK